MSATFLTLWVDDPQAVADWLAQHAYGHVLRSQAAELPAGGWMLWVALDGLDLNALFQRDWGHMIVTEANHRRWMSQGRYLGARSARQHFSK